MMDRKRGCLCGLAVGDALGAAVEFKMPGEFAPIFDYRTGGPHGLNIGEWTDDTSMALALADSLGRGFDQLDQLSEYFQWWKSGKYSVNGRCFDIGTTTRHAIWSYDETGNIASDTNPAASGNGSIMRLAPIPIKYEYHYPHLIGNLASLAEMSSVTTHGSEQCKSACRYMAVVLAALIHGEDRDEVLSPDWKHLKEIKAFDPNILKVIAGSYRSGEVKGSGWVVQSLEAALWAFSSSNSFEEAVLKAVNLGNDADTTGAVCGQFAGAYWGESGIPKNWLDRLARKDMIEEALTKIV